MKTISKIFAIVLVLGLVFGFAPMGAARAETNIQVYVLEPSWTAVGGGGVFSAYIAPPEYGYVSPGLTVLYDGREAGIIKAGLTPKTDGHYDDEGLFGFKPEVTIDTFAARTLTYDVNTQVGVNPVWMTIEIDTGVVGDREDNTTYQHVPTTNPAGWHTVNAAAGLWQKWNDDMGDVTGNPFIALADIAATHTGMQVVRAYLRLGMGDSYNNGGTGTIAWVDKVSMADITYDFLINHTWYVATTGSDTNQGTTENNPFLTIQHAVDNAVSGDIINVAAGIYNESLTINKALTLSGAGDDVTTVDGTGLTASTLLKSTGLTSGTLNISGFTFKDDPTSTAAMTYPLSFSACKSPATVNFTDNTVLGTGSSDYDWGLLLGYDSTCSYKINDNVFDNIGGNSILVEKAFGPVEIGFNDFMLPNEGGPAIFSMSYGTALVPNTVDGLHWYHDNNINAKEVDGNIWSGIVIAPAWGNGWNVRQFGSYTNVLIEDNVIEDFQSVGIQVEVDGENSTLNGVIQNNTLTAYPGIAFSKGIRLLGPVSDTSLLGNIITNGYRGIYLSGTWGQAIYPTNITSEKNRLAANTIGYEEQDTVNDQDASPNWWGSATGPTAGYIVSNLNYIPWCLDATCTTFGYPPVHNVTQDTWYMTIQSAINAANNGDQILVSAGTFDEDVNINKSITLTGAGAGISTIRGVIGGDGATIRIAASNIIIEGFSITRLGNNLTDWNNTGLNFAGIAIQGQANTGSIIRNNDFYGNRTGIDINDSSGHTITGNKINNNRTGLLMRNQTDNLVVTDNEIADNWTVGVLFLAANTTNVPPQQALNSTFNNNDLSGNWYGQVVDRQAGGSLPLPGTINLKDFTDNWWGTTSIVVSTVNSAEPGYADLIPVEYGGTAVPPSSPQPDILGAASANILYCPWLGSEDGETPGGPVINITQGTGFCTIQAAIDDAATINGDVIEVAAGTYTGPLLINKSVTLLGPNSAVNPNTGTRVAEAVLLGTTSSGLSERVDIDAVNVVLKGFTFENLRIDNYNLTPGTNTQLITGNVIENNIFTDVHGTAIYLRDGRDAPGSYSTGVSISNNKIDSITSEGGVDYNAGTGILLYGADASNVDYNVITSAKYNGIQLGRINGMTVTGNVATEAVQPALQIAQWSDGTNTISGNTFSTTSTTKAAIRLYAFTNNFYPLFNFTGNTIKDSKFGIQIGHGDPGKGYNDIRDADYSFSGNTFTNISTYRLIIYLATEATVAEKAEMDALFAGVYGAGNTATAITSADPFTYVVTACTTDCYIAKTGDDLNPGTESAPFLTIQKGIDAVSAAGTVHVAAGTYVENVVVNKSVTIDGAGTGTVVMPALSNPGVSLGGSLGGSNVFLVQANDVKITDLVIDGDNPALVSGVVVGGADLDARNGIITNHAVGVFNGLEVSYVTVRNIYLRGIYASSGGTFNIHHNSISNTQGSNQSFAIMVYQGTGFVADNFIDYGSAVGANYSQGTQWLRNTLTHTPGGIHTDNAGSPSILGSEEISGNNVDCGNEPSAYGIWTFVNRMPVTIQNNTVTGCEVAYSAWGSGNSSVATFQNNTATAPVPNNNSVGAYITTSGAGWGYFDVNADFTGNTLTGFETGVYISGDQTTWDPLPFVEKTITSDINRNNITGSTMYAAFQGTDGIYVVNLKENWWGSVLGPQAPISEDVDVIQWCGTANPTCEPLMPQNGNELTLSGTVDLGAINGLYVPEITILLSDGTTIQNTGEACFNVFADHTTIMAESKLGAKCVPAAGKNGVNVAAELQDINIINLEFDGSAGGVTGALFSGVVDYLTILDNWFHDFTGNAVEFQDQPTGVLGIQGNLFQENGGNGIQSYGSTIPAEFNAWGHIDGPAMGDGISNGVDADPWTHVDLYLYSTSPVSIGGQVTYTVYGNLANVMGAGFTLAYPTAKLQLVPASLTNLSSFVEVAPGAGVFDTTTAGEIRFAGTVSGSAAVSGKNMPIYSVEFNVLGDGGLLDLVEAGSDFPMASETADPTWTHAFSTNIYPMTFLDALVTINSYTVQGTFMMEYRYLNVRSGIPGALTGTSYGLYKATSVQAIPNNLKFLSVAPGTYTLTTNQPRYLNLTADLAKTVTVGSSNVTFSTPLTLIAGNAIWSDNEINITDAGLVGGKYGWNVGTSGATDADVDFSGAVGLSDLAIVGKNYGKSSAVNYSWLP